MKRIRDADDIPTGPSYAYHVAPTELLPSIRDEGVRPDTPTDEKWEPVNDFIQQAAPIVDGQHYPVNRNNAVFLFDAPDMPVSWVANREEYAVLCISLTGFTGSLYCAEMGPVTSLIQEYDRNNAVFDEALSQYQQNRIAEGSPEDGVITLLQRHMESLALVEPASSPTPLDAYGVELFTSATIPPRKLETMYVPDAARPVSV